MILTKELGKPDFDTKTVTINSHFCRWALRKSEAKNALFHCGILIKKVSFCKNGTLCNSSILPKWDPPELEPPICHIGVKKPPPLFRPEPAREGGGGYNEQKCMHENNVNR